MFPGPATRPGAGERPPVAVRLISVADLVDGRVVAGKGAQPWADLSADALQRHILRPGDVLVAARGSAPKVAWITDADLPAVASPNILVVRAADVRPGVVFTFLRSDAAAAIMRGLSRSTTDQLSITARDLGAIEMPIPPTAAQDTIHALVEAGESAYAAAITAAVDRRAAAHVIAMNMLRTGSAG